jgi:hypothetical protein
MAVSFTETSRRCCAEQAGSSTTSGWSGSGDEGLKVPRKQPNEVMGAFGLASKLWK